MFDEKISMEWYRGHIGDKSGIFPANFVKIIHTTE